MLFGNEFHILLGPWNRIEKFLTGSKIFYYLFYRYGVGKSQSIFLNFDESYFQFERFE